jgi:hypothetical protein
VNGTTPLRAGLAWLLAHGTVTLMDGREAVLVEDLAALLNPSPDFTLLRGQPMYHCEHNIPAIECRVVGCRGSRTEQSILADRDPRDPGYEPGPG